MKQLKKTLLCAHCLLGVFAQAQESRDIKYPKGMYMTFESYQNRKPTYTITAFHAETTQDSIKYRFYNTATAERLKKVFAFSDGENLFVNNKLLLKHMNRTDFGKQLRDDGRFYLKAKKIGSHYHYYENYYTGTGAALWGGIIATAASRRIKGMVYDVAHQEFNIFRNAKDFKHFIDNNHPNYLKQNGHDIPKKGKEDLAVIRRFVNQVY